MDFHELQKTRIADLRTMAKEKCPDVTGLIGLRKDELVDLLAERLHIERPHRHVVPGLGKRAIKAEIRRLKATRLDALASGDREALHTTRQAIHRRKRKLRRLASLG
ncbi:MAG: hypothetical protein IPK64_07045 [bacterium]|nr:hypothetical protein [bacterium]